MGNRNQISGESYYQGTICKCREGESILFIPEPDNPYDSKAVKVCRANGDTIGHIPKDDPGVVKPQLALSIELGLPYKAWIKYIGKAGGAPYLGVLIDYEFDPKVLKEYKKRHYLDRIGHYKKKLDKTKSQNVKDDAMEKIGYFESQIKKIESE